MNNEESQKDEICVLESIYTSEEFHSQIENGKISGKFDAFIEPPSPFCVEYRNLILRDDVEVGRISLKYLPPISLFFELPASYPSSSPPEIQISCSWLTALKVKKLLLKLDKLWEENKGTEILFTWTNFLKYESLQCLRISDCLDISKQYTKELRRSNYLKRLKSQKVASSQHNAKKGTAEDHEVVASGASISSNDADMSKNDESFSSSDVSFIPTPSSLVRSEKNDAQSLTEAPHIKKQGSEKCSKPQRHHSWDGKKESRGSFHGRSGERGEASTDRSEKVMGIRSQVFVNRSRNVDNINLRNHCDNSSNKYKTHRRSCHNNHDKGDNYESKGKRCMNEGSENKWKELDNGQLNLDNKTNKQSNSSKVHVLKKFIKVGHDERIKKCPTNSLHLHDYLIKFDEDRQKTIFGREIFKCEICFEDKQGVKCMQFRPCNHIFCRDCISEYFKVKINEGSVASMPCPQEKCSSEANQQQIRELVGPVLFSRYDSLLLSATLSAMDDITYCPRTTCQCPVMRDPDEKLARCPSCQYVFCVFCRMTYHGVEPCRLKNEERRNLIAQYENGDADTKKRLEARYGKKQIMNIIHTAQSENWITENSKQCPQCSASIEKSDGCNKMVCWKCSAFFCWLCGTILNTLDPYKHYFDPSSKCRDLLFHGTYEEDEEDDFFDVAAIIDDDFFYDALLEDHFIEFED